MIRNRTFNPPHAAPSLVELARHTIVAPARAGGGRVLEYQSETASPMLLCDGLLDWVDRRRWWLWAFVLLMYLAGFNGQWRIQPDAALYLSLGRNLAEGKGYTYLGEPHHLAYPGWPALIAVAFKLFASQSLVPVNLMVTTIALLTVGAVYRLFLLHCGRPTAVAVSVGVGLTKAFYCYGFELWADMAFSLGAVSFLAGYEGVLTRRSLPEKQKFRRRIVDSIFLIGGLLLALTTRPTIWPLLLAMGCALPIDAIRGRIRWRSVITIACCLILLGGAMLFGSRNFGAVYGQYLINRLTGTQESGLAPSILHNTRTLLEWAASDVLFQVRLGPFFNALLSIVVLLLGFGLFRYRSLWGFWFCLLLATILISQEALDRYFLPVLPLLVFAWWDVLVRINKMLEVRAGNLAFLGLLGFGMLMNFTKVCGIIAQQHTRPFLASYDSGKFEDIPEFARQLAAHVEPNAIVLIRSPYGRVSAFLSRRSVESPAEVALSKVGRQPIYVVEPLDSMTTKFLSDARLAEGPAVFTVRPSPKCAAGGMVLSLHATQPLR